MPVNAGNGGGDKAERDEHERSGPVDRQNEKAEQKGGGNGHESHGERIARMKNKLIIGVLVAVAAFSALVYAQRKGGEPMQTFEACDVPQGEVWNTVKYAKGEGFQVFTFEFTQAGEVNIRAVRGFVVD